MTHSIYYMERPVTQTWFGEPCVRSHHAFLALVKEQVGVDSVIEQEIHFKDEGFLRLKIYDFPKNSGDHFSELCPYGHIGGSEDHMLSIWDRAVDVAKQIDDAHLLFGKQGLKHSFNCRSATIALLNSIGLEYYAPDGVNSDAGTKADIISKLGLKEPVENFSGHNIIFKFPKHSGAF